MISHADVVTSGIIRDYGNYQVVDHENFKAGIYEEEKLLYEIKSHLIETDVFLKAILTCISQISCINEIYY